MTDNVIFVLDTNVISDIFESSPNYYNFIVQCLEMERDRIYLTDTIYHELSPIKDKPYKQPSVQKYKEEFLDLLNKNIEKESLSVKRLRKFENHFSDKTILDNIISILDNGRAQIEKLLDDIDFSILFEPSLSKIDENYIKNFIRDLEQQSRIGLPLSRGTLDKVSYDAEKKLNPDKNKKGISKFNDYFIIEELKNLSKKESKNIIFVTSDVKGNFQEEIVKALFREETSRELIIKSSNEFYTSIAEEHNISQENIIEVFIANDKFDFLDELERNSQLDRFVEDYLLNDIEGEDEELESYDLSLQDIKVDFYDENSVTYLVTANLESEKIFYDYWGRDDDTKEIVTSPANYKTYTGKINISVTRNFEVLGKILKTKSFNLEHIDTSELEIEINTWEEFDDEMF